MGGLPFEDENKHVSQVVRDVLTAGVSVRPE